MNEQELLEQLIKGIENGQYLREDQIIIDRKNAEKIATQTGLTIVTPQQDFLSSQSLSWREFSQVSGFLNAVQIAYKNIPNQQSFLEFIKSPEFQGLAAEYFEPKITQFFENDIIPIYWRYRYFTSNDRRGHDITKFIDDNRNYIRAIRFMMRGGYRPYVIGFGGQ